MQTRTEDSRIWARARKRRHSHDWQRMLAVVLSLRGFTQLCCALYLALYLVAAGPLTQQVWFRGGHATPEQWAYHTLLERMGIPHHHGDGGVHTHGASGLHMHLSPDDGHVLGAVGPQALQLALALFPLPSATVTALPPLTVAPDTTLQLIHILLTVLTPPAVAQRLEPADRPALSGVTLTPPEKPPSSQR